MIVVIAALACLWGAKFVYLVALGDEGSMPPQSRIPQVPAGATVVSQEKSCGSGGCWWEVTVQPPAGQSPEELARQMGLGNEQEKAPTLTDPGSVYVGATAVGGQLKIHVGYQ
ncbi:hypothetical protein [Actinoplanes sp. HUAS TT8]|uniref:hypothetical protein n=1 Tax=Actinoplanes sp. HUAS TT8 TaxID=3447453 RepID=UPI003F51C14C